VKVRLVLRKEQGVSRRYRVARCSQIRLNISHSPGLHGLFPAQLIRASTDSTRSQQSSNMQQLCDDNFPVDRDYCESAASKRCSVSERSKTGLKDRAYEDRGARTRRDSCANTGDYARLVAVTYLADRLKIGIAKSKGCVCYVVLLFFWHNDLPASQKKISGSSAC